MTDAVQRLTEQLEALRPEELDEFLSWLAQHELDRSDAWDSEIERDSQPGGRLEPLLERAREDVEAGRTKSLDEVINHE